MHKIIECDNLIQFAHDLIDGIVLSSGTDQEFMHTLYTLSATLIHWLHYC